MVEEQPQEHLKFQSTLLHGERPTIRQPLPWWTRFNPRSRTGATGIQTAGREMHEGFNPRFRTGSDLSGLYLSIGISCFNPRSRTGSDAVCLCVRYWCYISIHAPARGATGSRIGGIMVYQFQSTLPHGERRRGSCSEKRGEDFNPRSRTGSDLPREADRGRPMGFQSTLPHGERLTAGKHIDSVLVISIHAPARGATYKPAASWHPPPNFNPRSRTGSDIS